MIDLIVFDLDGTLVDSQADIASGVNALVEELGGQRLGERAVAGMVGEGAPLLVRRALTAAALDPATPGTLERFLDLYAERALDRTVAYAGLVQTLERLHGSLAMSVLTNKPAGATKLILDGLDLSRWFQEAIGGDSRWGRKPDPAGLLHLVDAAGTSPDRTLMVGDSPIDLATARQAGTRICLARYGFGYQFGPDDFSGTELFIDSPAELVDICLR